MSDLADVDLNELVIELFLMARREAHGVNALEHFAAANPTSVAERVLADVKRSADLIGKAHLVMKALAKRPVIVRALICEVDA